MIPKIIHYCWFGGNPLPDLALRCLKSWKKYCPDYEIIEWTEHNFDIDASPLYVRQAYEAKKWAFVSDYARLKILYEYGGVYLDTDVEVIKNLDRFLDCTAFFGIEINTFGVFVATGLGFGAEKHAEVLLRMLREYDEIPFLRADGGFDNTACPVRNTKALLDLGFVQEDRCQQLAGNINIYSTEYFCPKSFYDGIIRKTKNSCTIHHYSASWHTKDERDAIQAKWKKIRRKQLPMIISRRVLGKNVYEGIRRKLKG